MSLQVILMWGISLMFIGLAFLLIFMGCAIFIFNVQPQVFFDAALETNWFYPVTLGGLTYLMVAHSIPKALEDHELWLAIWEVLAFLSGVVVINVVVLLEYYARRNRHEHQE
ncbi:hypothetical protein DdX_13597 [Ditylenchus destructor]|uniref:Uncharacterized protein n=1 Tax=Ditylenchus destructor TaxID=166010 RepID=A0AAD4MW74_9BILA|nr:hypothetical protein DdX_13597 [Ditylenchus destructor]